MRPRVEGRPRASVPDPGFLADLQVPIPQRPEHGIPGQRISSVFGRLSVFGGVWGGAGRGLPEISGTRGSDLGAGEVAPVRKIYSIQVDRQMAPFLIWLLSSTLRWVRSGPGEGRRGMRKMETAPMPDLMERPFLAGIWRSLLHAFVHR